MGFTIGKGSRAQTPKFGTEFFLERRLTVLQQGIQLSAELDVARASPIQIGSSRSGIFDLQGFVEDRFHARFFRVHGSVLHRD